MQGLRFVNQLRLLSFCSRSPASSATHDSTSSRENNRSGYGSTRQKEAMANHKKIVAATGSYHDDDQRNTDHRQQWHDTIEYFELSIQEVIEDKSGNNRDDRNVNYIEQHPAGVYINILPTQHLHKHRRYERCKKCRYGSK